MAVDPIIHERKKAPIRGGPEIRRCVEAQRDFSIILLGCMQQLGINESDLEAALRNRGHHFQIRTFHAAFSGRNISETLRVGIVDAIEGIAAQSNIFVNIDVLKESARHATDCARQLDRRQR